MTKQKKIVLLIGLCLISACLFACFFSKQALKKDSLNFQLSDTLKAGEIQSASENLSTDIFSIDLKHNDSAVDSVSEGLNSPLPFDSPVTTPTYGYSDPYVIVTCVNYTVKINEDVLNVPKIENEEVVDEARLNEITFKSGKKYEVFKSGENIVLGILDSHTEYITFIPNDGYKITKIVISCGIQYITGLSDEQGTSVTITNDSNISSTSNSFSFETIDKYYSGKINFSVKTEEIQYETTLYYNSNGIYGVKNKTIKFYYTISGADIGTLYGSKIGGDGSLYGSNTYITSNGDIFSNWVVNTRTLTNDRGWSISYSEPNNTLTITKGSKTVIFKTNGKYSTEIYNVTHISGTMNFINCDNKLIYAVWAAPKTVTIQSVSDIHKDTSLYGAYSEVSGTKQGSDSVTIKVNSVSSNPLKATNNASAFNKYTQSSVPDANYCAKDCAGKKYTVYNYGYQLTGWYIYNGTSYKDYLPLMKYKNINNTISDLYNKVIGLNNPILKPVWMAAKINVFSDEIYRGQATYNSEYKFTLSQPIEVGKTFVVYKDSKSSCAILPSGTWNYTDIPGNSFAFVSEGEYELKCSNCFSTNLYKVKLEDVDSEGTLGCYTSEEGSSSDAVVIEYSYTSGSTTMDTATNAYAGLTQWNTKLTAKQHEKQQKVFNYSSSYYIYLAHGQSVEGDLPVYNTDAKVLNFWYSKTNVSSVYKAYKTSQFNENQCQGEGNNKYTIAKIGGIDIKFYVSGSIGNTFYKTWEYDELSCSTTLYANYFRKQYNLTADFVLNDAYGNEHGAAKITITDTEKEGYGGTYIAYNNNFYNCTKLSDVDESSNKIGGTLKFYSLCNIKIEAYDQSYSKGNSKFINFVGKRFLSMSLDSLIDVENQTKSTNEIKAATIIGKGYSNGANLKLILNYERIQYSLGVSLNDINAGDLKISIGNNSIGNNSIPGSYMYYELKDDKCIELGDKIHIEYNANAGYEFVDVGVLQFVCSTAGQLSTGASLNCNHDVGDKQDQKLSVIINSELLNYYYSKQNTEYDTNDNYYVGRLQINTKPFSFKHLYVLKDGTDTVGEVESADDVSFVNKEFGKVEKVSLNPLCETTKYSECNIIEYSKIKYAILSSELDSEHKECKHLMEFDFLNNLSSSDVEKYDITAGELTKILGVENGVIIPKDNRTIRTIISVKPLKEIKVSVATDSHDPEVSTPSVTIKNGKNNSVTIVKEEPKTVLTYVGLENLIVLNYNSLHYTGARKVLNNDSELTSDKFTTTTKDCSLGITFITKPLKVEASYKYKAVDTSPVVATEEQKALVSSSELTTNDLYIDYTFAYLFKLNDYDINKYSYYLKVEINGTEQNRCSESAPDTYEGTYTVSGGDYNYNNIQIVVTIVEKDKNTITAKYLLSDSKQGRADDDFGSLDIILIGAREDTVTSEEGEAEAKVTVGWKVQIDYSKLAYGYQFEKIRHDGYDFDTEIDRTNKLITITDSFAITDDGGDAGVYTLLIKKIEFEAELNLSNSTLSNKFTAYKMTVQNRDAKINGTSKIIESVVVGDKILCSYKEQNTEALVNFYYQTFESITEPVVVEEIDTEIYRYDLEFDETLDCYVLVITSEIYKKAQLNSRPLVIYIDVLPKYQFTYEIVNKKYLASSSIKIDGEDKDIVSGRYIKSGTTVNTEFKLSNEDKYNIGYTLNGKLKSEEEIKAIIIGKENLVDNKINLKVEARPNEYNIYVKGHVYTNLINYLSLTPDELGDIEKTINSSFGSYANIVLKSSYSSDDFTNGLTLKYIVISGNDFGATYRLVIDGRMVKKQKLVEGEYVDCTDALAVNVSFYQNDATLTILTSNNATIYVQYVENKLISQLN